MSLHSHLRDPQSPVSLFFREQFPNVPAVLQPLRPQISSAPTIRPAERIPYDLIGMALDYRLRYYFQVTPWPKLNAAVGAAVACGLLRFGRRGDRPAITLRQELCDEYRGALESALQTLQPAGRRLAPEQEVALARHCIVLALFEVIQREGLEVNVERSRLFVPEPPKTVADLLSIPEEHWIKDLCNLSWGFYDHYADLLQQPVILNPTFQGSADVGGADADLIVGNCLLEIKTIVDPLRLDRWREMLYQLLGYSFLDYEDRYGVREVGVYLARQRLLLRWPLDGLMAALADKQVPELASLRVTFRRTARGPQASGTTLSPEESRRIRDEVDRLEREREEALARLRERCPRLHYHGEWDHDSSPSFCEDCGEPFWSLILDEEEETVALICESCWEERGFEMIYHPEEGGQLVQ